MTYNELKQRVENLRPCRASWRNQEKLGNVGLHDGAVFAFKGSNGRVYRVMVVASRDYIGLQSGDSHKMSTIEKWCGDSVNQGHLVDIK